MIHLHVSAVCQVRDGFTGRPIESAGLRCALDGAPVRAVCKPGGYLVLLNLSEGPHRLSLRRAGFKEELTDFSVSAGSPEKLYLSLKPTEDYVFRQEAVWLHLRLFEKKEPATGRAFWLTVPTASECRIAQEAAEVGEDQFRIFCKSAAEPLTVPGTFLIEDGKDSEIVSLLFAEEETGKLAAPLAHRHKRSKCLLPAQQFRTDRDGWLTAVFRSGGTVAVYEDGRGTVDTLELAESRTERLITL